MMSLHNSYMNNLLINRHIQAGDQHQRMEVRPKSRANGRPVLGKWQSIQNLGGDNSLYINTFPIPDRILTR